MSFISIKFGKNIPLQVNSLLLNQYNERHFLLYSHQNRHESFLGESLVQFAEKFNEEFENFKGNSMNGTVFFSKNELPDLKGHTTDENSDKHAHLDLHYRFL